MPHLTEQYILDLKPSDKPYEVRDDDPVGLLVRVEKKGVKSFYVEYGRGKRVRICRFGELPLKSLKAVRLKAKEIQVSAKNGQFKTADSIKCDITYGEYLDGDYSSYLQANNKSWKNEYKMLKYAFSQLPDKKLSKATVINTKLNEITPLELERLKNKWICEGISKKTVNRRIASFKASLNRAVELKHIKENPIRDVKQIKTSKKSIVRYLSSEERAKIEKALPEFPQWFQVLVFTGLNTGLRKNEIIRLKWSDIKFDVPLQNGGTFSYITIVDSNSKNHDTDRIPLNTSTEKLLKDWKTECKNDTWVFPNPETDLHYKDCRKPWDKLREKTGLVDDSNFRFHDMRHDTASQLAMKGVSLQVIGEILRHKTLETTRNYAHLSPKTLIEAVQKLE